MANEKIKTTNEANWQSDVLDAEVPVLVDFWAEWCGPCKAIAPILDELADDLENRLKIVKVNVDESPELASQYAVRSIPTLLVIKTGSVAEQMVGALSKSALQEKLTPHLDG